MIPQKQDTKQFAMCCVGTESDLAWGKIYRVLPDESAARSQDVRVIDESGEDYLYPEECFVFMEGLEGEKLRQKPSKSASETQARYPFFVKISKIFDIFDSNKEPIIEANAYKANHNAIASDWNVVGDDLREAILFCEEKHPELKEVTT